MGSISEQEQKKSRRMVRIFLLFGIIVITTNSCQSDDNNMKYVDLALFGIADIVDDYYQSYLTDVDFEYAISLEVTIKNSKEIIKIYYDRNLFKVYNESPAYYSKFRDHYVLIWSNSLSGENGKKLNKCEIFKDAFPEQYAFYNEKNFLPPPILFQREARIYENRRLIETSMH